MKPSSCASSSSATTLDFPADTRSANGGFIKQAAKQTIFNLLGKLRAGSVGLVDGNECHVFGTPAAGEFPDCTVTIHRKRAYGRMLAGGTLGAAESYMDGDWSCTNLTTLIRLFIRNQKMMDDMEGGMARISGAVQRIGHWLRRNNLGGSRKNIAAHYDLSNEFFALFLDETMMYSSACFETDTATLAEASAAKNERLCRLLKLSPKDHLLEIGTGWGGFAIHAAKNFGCSITTTTISKRQYALACERVAREGLSGRVTVLLEDYRELKGRYDKLVSIEMIEAVGHHYLNTFFKRCGELLKPHGAMALQAITIPDKTFDMHARSVDFIKKHIFPGSCLPSVARMLEATRKCTDLNLAHLNEITPHYSRTLKIWRERFFDNIEHVRRLGFNEAFIRMWEFYLCYCEAGFSERYIGSVQLLFAKPGWQIESAGVPRYV